MTIIFLFYVCKFNKKTLFLLCKYVDFNEKRNRQMGL